MSLESQRECRRCATSRLHVLTRNQTLNGSVMVGWLCSVCLSWTTDKRGRLWIPLTDLRTFGVNVDELPIRSTIAACERCARCGARNVEVHHWAPRALFGAEEAERWPKDHMCPTCHSEWHRVVTPGLVEGKAS